MPSHAGEDWRGDHAARFEGTHTHIKKAVGLYSEHFFSPSQTEKSLTTLNPLNDAEDPPSFQQIPRVPGRNYLMQLRR